MITLDLPPAVLGVGAGVPMLVTSDANAVAPAGIVVPGPRPAFIATVTVDVPGQQVQVQWSTDPGFPDDARTGAAVADAPAGLDDAQVVVQASADVPDGLAWWRARILGAYGAGAWSPPLQFGVDSLEGVAVAAGTVTVNAAAGVVPHLWYIDHARTSSDPGGQAVVVGAGFGPAPQVLLGALPCTVGNVAVFPATASDGTAERVLSDAWHEEITFTIPDVGPDHVGDAVTIVRGD